MKNAWFGALVLGTLILLPLVSGAQEDSGSNTTGTSAAGNGSGQIRPSGRVGLQDGNVNGARNNKIFGSAKSKKAKLQKAPHSVPLKSTSLNHSLIPANAVHTVGMHTEIASPYRGSNSARAGAGASSNLAGRSQQSHFNDTSANRHKNLHRHHHKYHAA